MARKKADTIPLSSDSGAIEEGMSTDTINIDAVKETYQFLIGQLHEQHYAARAHIWYIIQICGVDFANAVYQETLRIQNNGGMKIDEYSRLRTIGGVFFKLAKDGMSPEDRKLVFGYTAESTHRPQQPRAVVTPMVWEERKPVLIELARRTGEVRKLKVSITGRPGKITEQEGCIITLMRDKSSAPSLPKGLPQPPTGTVYGVYIGRKQWTPAIKKALEDPSDELIVDGYLAFDKQMGVVCVFAQSVSTRAIKRALKEAQAASGQ